MTTDNFAPEQIAADKAVANAATPAWLTGKRDDGTRWLSIGNPCAGPHYQADICCSDADAIFLHKARVRWIAALDEIERLQNIIADRDSFIFNDTHATALERKDHEAEIERLQRLNSLNERVMENAGRSVDVLDSAGMGKRIGRGNCLIDMAQEAAETLTDLRAENAAMSEALASLMHWMRGLRPTGAGSPGPLFTAGMGMIAEACEKKADEVGATLSDAVARGNKLLELERRDTPASILRHSGFRSFACKCGGFPEQDSKFCGECGSRLEWV